MRSRISSPFIRIGSSMIQLHIRRIPTDQMPHTNFLRSRFRRSALHENVLSIGLQGQPIEFMVGRSIFGSVYRLIDVGTYEGFTIRRNRLVGMASHH